MEPAFIIFGGAMSYIIGVAVIIFLLLATEYDNGWAASGITAAAIITLAWGMDINIFSWVWDNPFTALERVAYYFALGAAWGVFKWWFYCIKLLDVVKDIKVEYMNRHKITGSTIPEDRSEDFANEVVGSRKYKDAYYPPQSLGHKADWLMWATWWPISCFWTM